jgi:two-component system, LuxR family, sensor kinase FixL
VEKPLDYTARAPFAVRTVPLGQTMHIMKPVATARGAEEPPPLPDPLRGPSGLPRPRVALAVVLTAGIFVFDTVSPAGIAVAVLYVLVILMVLDVCDRRGVLLVSLGCALLTLLAYLISHSPNYFDSSLLRCLVSLSAIGITAVLALRNKRSTEILSRSERRYRNIFDTAGVAIWEHDLSQVKLALDRLTARGVADVRRYLIDHPQFVENCIAMVRIVDANSSAVALLGARNKAEATSSLKAFFLPKTVASFRELISAMFEGKRSFSYETVIRTAGGEPRAILMTATFPTEADMFGNVLVSVFDITERNRTEQALQQAQAELAHVSRVATLGELTASIAHEVNQPLAAVVTNGDACLRWIARQPPELNEARTCLLEIVTEGRRAGDVIQRLRALSGKSEPQPVALDVGTTIAEAVLLLRRQAQDLGVEIRLAVEPSLPPVRADRVQLQQVIINLAINGMQAMGETPAAERELTIAAAAVTNQMVQLSVCDRGTGIAATAASRLFEPFFTTKRHGMGMGLSICRSIVESLGGRLWAENNTRRGATLYLTLPVATEGMT